MPHKDRRDYPRLAYGEITEILPIMTPKRVARFRAKISTAATVRGCLLWIPKARNNKGYGLFQGAVGYLGFSFLAHRVAWALHHETEPGKQVIRHRCDNPACCNPEHLIAGTHSDNMLDAVSRGRAFGIGDHARSKHGVFANAADYTETQRRIAISMRYRHYRNLTEITAEIGCHRSTLARWFREFEQLPLERRLQILD